MKIPIPLLIVLLTAAFALGTLYKHTSSKQEDTSIKFIWNDVEESIPVDGSLIRLEFTDENNVYIGPAN
jgi:hypothetical protein